MIDRLSVKNFKSIKCADLKLGKFSVLIGANGSGKSNLVKCVDFIGEIARGGVFSAVNRFGGFAGIVPKAFDLKDVKKARISLEYTVSLMNPNDSYSSSSAPSVAHNIELLTGGRNFVRVGSEMIKFDQVIPVGMSFSTKQGEVGPDSSGGKES